MAFQFPAHIIEKMRRVREYTDSCAAEFASLSDNELAVSAEFWRQHCVPEMIKRLKERD